jgi:SAM-dependent methyltransferase
MKNKIKECRSCKSNQLKLLFSLGSMPYSGIFPKRNQSIDFGKLTLVICKQCKLVQLDRNFNPKKMYGYNYGYRTGLNSSMVKHMMLKAKKLKKYLNYKNEQIILDIGSNDGTFLGFFVSSKSNKYKLFGMDPTIRKFKRFYKKRIITLNDFFSYKAFIKKSNKKADLITTISMLYDLPDPKAFIQDIYNSLNEDGVWHTEQSYLKNMLQRNSYDTICHEHIEYYSLQSLKYLFDSVGFKIIEIDFNDTNGGSIAITLAKANSKNYKEQKEKIRRIINDEKKIQLNNPKIFNKFFIRVKKESQKLVNLLRKIKNEDKLVLGYGASTKGNIILNFCKINSKLLKYIGEVNPFKFGKQTPGSEIEIIPEDKARKMKPDFFLVFPWHFKNFILQKEKKFMKKNSTRFIFPLPKLSIE